MRLTGVRLIVCVQVDTIDGLVPIVPTALSRVGESNKALLRKDIKDTIWVNRASRSDELPAAAWLRVVWLAEGMKLTRRALAVHAGLWRSTARCTPT